MSVYHERVHLRSMRGSLVSWKDSWCAMGGLSKGDIAKSRLVAQESASSGDRDDILAATPSQKASKFVFSDTASRETFDATPNRLCVLESLLAWPHRGRDQRRAPGRGHLTDAGVRGKIDQSNV